MISRDSNGRFVKGVHSNPNTEFKKGEHWRPKKPFWDKSWLLSEYIDKERSSIDIANQFGVTESAILFWLRKHNIPRRSMAVIRANKHWGVYGKSNGMYGRTGCENPNWKGGATPERQYVYTSQEWRQIRRFVFERDGKQCQRCGDIKRLQIHHIISFSIPEFRVDINNLILLCRKCHIWVHSKKNIDKNFIKEEVRNELVAN